MARSHLAPAGRISKGTLGPSAKRPGSTFVVCTVLRIPQRGIVRCPANSASELAPRESRYKNMRNRLAMTGAPRSANSVFL